VFRLCTIYAAACLWRIFSPFRHIDGFALHVFKSDRKGKHFLGNRERNHLWSIEFHFNATMPTSPADLFIELSLRDRDARDHVEELCRWACDVEILQSAEMRQRVLSSWVRLCVEMLQALPPPSRLIMGDTDELHRQLAASNDLASATDELNCLEETRKLSHKGNAAFAAACVSLEDILEEVERLCTTRYHLTTFGAAPPMTTTAATTTTSPSSPQPTRGADGGYAHVVVEHVLETELPRLVADWEEARWTLQANIDDTRNDAVQWEVSRRAISRQRLQRLSKLEAERRQLERNLAERREACAALHKRVERELAASQKHRGAVFERFSLWDLQRRALAHILHNQSMLSLSMEAWAEAVSHGLATATSDYNIATSNGCDINDDDGIRFDKDRKLLDRRDQSRRHRDDREDGAASSGSVEWLERLRQRWNSIVSSAPTFVSQQQQHNTMIASPRPMVSADTEGEVDDNPNNFAGSKRYQGGVDVPKETSRPARQGLRTPRHNPDRRGREEHVASAKTPPSTPYAPTATDSAVAAARAHPTQAACSQQQQQQLPLYDPCHRHGTAALTTAPPSMNDFLLPGRSSRQDGLLADRRNEVEDQLRKIAARCT
jgi:hypothetical protein